MPSSNDRDEPVRGGIPAAERDAFKRRTADLDKRLRAARGEPVDGDGTSGSGSSAGRGVSGMGQAMRMSTEFVAAIAVGAGLGLLLDNLIGSWPLLFILLFLIGAAAGIRNMIQAAMNTRTGPLDPTKGPSVPDDDDEDDDR